MITREVGKAWQFFREKGFKETLLSREAPFLIQFGKYGVCGVISVVVLALVIYLGEALAPQYFSDNLPDKTIAWNTAILHFIAFVPSNFVAYGLNRWLVFTPGRHSVKKEMILFTIISLVSFSIGEMLPFWLINNLDLPRPVVHFSFIISSAMVNFVCRKFLVFEK
ncbi:MAG: GtrA family protein [Akkermansiaceae bacterium]